MPARRTAAIVLAFGAMYVCWGGTFLALRIVVSEVPPIMTIALRCAGGAAVLGVLMAAQGGFVRPSRREWSVAILSGIALFVGCHAFLADVERRVSSGQAALYMTAIPMWMVVLLALESRKVPRLMELLALAIGTLGIAALAGGARANPVSLRDGIVLVGASLAWAVGTLIATGRLARLPAPQATTMQLAGGAAALLVAAAVSGELTRWEPLAISARAVWAMLFLIFAGTAAGFGAYMWLLRVVSPTAVGSYAFVNPIVALLIGALAGDEVLTWRSLLSAALVVVAVVLLQRRPRSVRREPPPGERPLEDRAGEHRGGVGHTIHA